MWGCVKAGDRCVSVGLCAVWGCVKAGGCWVTSATVNRDNFWRHTLLPFMPLKEKLCKVSGGAVPK